MKGFIKLSLLLSSVAIFVLAGCARDRDFRLSSDNSFDRNSSPSYNQASAANNQGTTDSNVVQHKLCPVTGEPLGSMGDSIPVVANGKTIFVCCQGCIKSVKRDPAKYLAIALAE